MEERKQQKKKNVKKRNKSILHQSYLSRIFQQSCIHTNINLQDIKLSETRPNISRNQKKKKRKGIKKDEKGQKENRNIQSLNNTSIIYNLNMRIHQTITQTLRCKSTFFFWIPFSFGDKKKKKIVKKLNFYYFKLGGVTNNKGIFT